MMNSKGGGETARPSLTNIPKGCQASMRRGAMMTTTTTAVEASGRARKRLRAEKKC